MTASTLASVPIYRSASTTMVEFVQTKFNLAWPTPYGRDLDLDEI